MIKKGEESDLEKTIKTIKDSCCMSWIVLSPYAVQDSKGDNNLLHKNLEAMVTKIGFGLVKLQKIVRNSSSIFSATAPEVMCGMPINNSSICSTVPGPRPFYYLYEYSDNGSYDAIARCVNNYLQGEFNEPSSKHTAILCSANISPRQVKPLLTGDITLYDGGVEIFEGFNYIPQYYSVDKARQREDLESWLKTGGVLLTHYAMFRGCEAQTVVFIALRGSSSCTRFNRYTPHRSGPSRAVSQLCVVTSDFEIDEDMLKEHWTLKKLDG